MLPSRRIRRFSESLNQSSLSGYDGGSRGFVSYILISPIPNTLLAFSLALRSLTARSALSLLLSLRCDTLRENPTTFPLSLPCQSHMLDSTTELEPEILRLSGDQVHFQLLILSENPLCPLNLMLDPPHPLAHLLACSSFFSPDDGLKRLIDMQIGDGY